MFVSMNWIKEYVNLDGLNIENLIQRFTLSTAEVEDIIYKGSEVKDVVCGQVVSFEMHPDSKKLHLLKIDAGDRIYDCVCGAPNVSLGQKVAFVKAGGRVPAGEIKECLVAGYKSEGMCCSEAELGISDDHTGIMEFDEDIPVGTDLKSIYPIDDIIFEVDNKSLTNRPDLWGHYGIAREFAALTERELKPLSLTLPEYVGDKAVSVNVLSTDLVYRYSCIKMDNIKRKKSPLELRIRLFYCGMRAINFLADLTNYIMLELGQPMHAFDANKIETINVATPDKEIEFTTLDGAKREVGTETLLIYNNYTPVAIAGIMGGLDSEIVDDTDSVVLESANFDGVSVRKSSSALGLRTDASMRYEKILDPELTLTAIYRFINLVTTYDKDAYCSSKITDVYVKKYPSISLEFDKKYVDRYTGIDIENEKIVSTLNNLGFVCKETDNVFSVDVPSWRATKDVTIKADIIEEITRIYGYDNFKITTTNSPLYPVRETVEKNEEGRIKDILVNKYSLNEVHSYIWCDGKKYKKLGIEVEDNVRILNIPTPENGTIRNSMIPTLLSFVYENKKYADDFGIFEVGRVVDGVTPDGTCDEKRMLGVTLYNKNSLEKELFFNALAMVKYIVSSLKHSSPAFLDGRLIHKWQHPKNTSEIFIEGLCIGYIGTLHPQNLSKLDKNASVVYIEIDMDKLAKAKKSDIVFDEPSKFPSTEYDISVVLPAGRIFSEMEKAWKNIDCDTLKEANVIDVYETETEKSITVRCVFSHSDRTLTSEEVQENMDRIISALAENGFSIKS